MIYTPIILQPTNRGERAYDLWSRLLTDRVIFLNGHIDSDIAALIVGQLLFLDAQSPDKDIYMYISSSGGSVVDGFSIYDVMQYIRPDVTTICLGQCASMAAFLLSSGARGKRCAFANSEIMIHQVKAGNYGQATDIVIHAKRIEEMNHNLVSILARNCSKPLRQMEYDTDRDNFMSAGEALEYGLIDKIIAHDKIRESYV